MSSPSHFFVYLFRWNLSLLPTQPYCFTHRPANAYCAEEHPKAWLILGAKDMPQRTIEHSDPAHPGGRLVIALTRRTFVLFFSDGTVMWLDMKPGSAVLLHCPCVKHAVLISFADDTAERTYAAATQGRSHYSEDLALVLQGSFTALRRIAEATTAVTGGTKRSEAIKIERIWSNLPYHPTSLRNHVLGLVRDSIPGGPIEEKTISRSCNGMRGGLHWRS
jgi:hypothetical protein